jgi:hypothetical protein
MEGRPPRAQVICTKVRDGDKRIVRLKEGVAKGRHVVIVDDLVQSGGTLIECQRLLTTQVRAAPAAPGRGPPAVTALQSAPSCEISLRLRTLSMKWSAAILAAGIPHVRTGAPPAM